MGVRILVGREQGWQHGEPEKAVLFDSVTGWAFGPVIGENEEDGTSAEDMAEMFLRWVQEQDRRDPRQIPPGDMERLYGEWRATLKSAA